MIQLQCMDFIQLQCMDFITCYYIKLLQVCKSLELLQMKIAGSKYQKCRISYHSLLLILLVFMMASQFGSAQDCNNDIWNSATCNCGNYYWNCYGSCWNDNNGNYYGCSSDGNPYYYVTYQYYYWNSNYRVNIYEFCHPWCSSCSGGNSNQYCQSCYGGYWHWQINSWQTGNVCNTYCPRAGYYLNQPSYVGQYKQSSGTQCGNCPNYCSWCGNYPNQNTCYTCTSNYYLFDDRSNQCSNTFGFDFASSGFSIPQAQYCYASCPSMYYFPVPQASTGSYTSWTNSIYLTDDAGTGVYVRRNSDVCVPCSSRCRTCYGQSNTQCYSCTINSYFWIQNSWQGAGNTCNYYCPRAGYYAGQPSYVGQYKSSDTRTCSNCPNYCSWCLDYPNQNTCQTCTSGYYLFDDRSSQCSNTFGFDFTSSGFTIPQAQYCYTSCPMYYFGVNQSATGSYTSWTNSIILTDNTGTQVTNRRNSDVCVPCSFRCRVCTGMSNTQCSSCTINSYFWIQNSWQGAGATCNYYCPRAGYYAGQPTYVGQFMQSDLRTCGNCPNNCSWCLDDPNQNTCYTCTSGHYLFDDRSSQCSNTFGFDFADSGFTIPQAQYCYGTCPMYYFGVNHSATSSYTWTNVINLTDHTGTQVTTRRTSDVCVPCDYRCRTCFGISNTQCYGCTINSYYWIQNSWQPTTNICTYYCPRAGYYAGQPSYVGQFKQSDLRTCGNCPNYCSWCLDYPNQNTCQTCTSGYYLFDDRSNQCSNTFGFDFSDSGFIIPQAQYCYTSCPMYYFGVNQSATGSYTSWTNSIVLTDNTGTQVTNRRNSDVCVPCSFRCRACTGFAYTQCSDCTIGSYLWIQTPWQGSATTCYSYCPRATYSAGNPSWVGQYMPSTGRVCLSCPNYCSWCKDGANYNYCYTCTAGYYLVDDTYNQCNPTFSFDFANSGVTCATPNLCYATCPMYYFGVNKTNTASYTWTATPVITYAPTSSSVTIKQASDTCIPCDYRCRTCFGIYNYQCYSCTKNSYLSVQSPYSNNCDTFCRTGGYLLTDNIGEYIVSGIGLTSRVCTLCDSNCKFCLSYSYNCYLCRDSAFLIDNMATCQSTFPSSCSACNYYQTNYASQSCQSRDQMCMTSQCPNYFYFQTYRIAYSNTSSQQDWSVNFNRYNSYTLAATITGALNNNTESYVYRSLTNLCVLCDFRCIQCVGPTNYNCSSCVNNYYKWQVQTVCQSQCPDGQYEDHTTVAPFQQTLCQYCNNFCYQCDITSINCTRCKGDNYQFTNANASYLYNYNQTYSNCLASCPTSSTPSSIKGYYGSIYTMTCYQCPGGCSNCNINLMKTAVTNGWFNCGTDQYCQQGLICTDCLLGYSLVSGQCIDQNSCRKYAYYLPGNISTQWTAAKCFCLRGYYMNNYVSCDILCDITCLTCNGTASNQCTSCQTGFTLSSGSCVSSQIIRSDTYVATSSQTYFTDSYSTSYGCTYTIRFGYLHPQASKYIYYQSPSISTNYYAVSIKMRVMFIDQWPQNGAIYVNYNNNGTSSPDWTWTYNNYGAIGQQACGTNSLDYLMTLFGQVSTQPLSLVKLYITSNVDLIKAQTGLTYYWGMKDMIVTVLKCNAACSTCVGPLATDCIICSDSTKTVVNGTCTCNTASGYFYVSGSSCNFGCAGGYTDYVKAICVYPTTSNCTPPYLYGSPTGNCTQTCPAGYYATDIWKICVNDCGQSGLAQYKYDGAQRTCQTACPSGFIAYAPSSTANWYCVSKCPANYYFMLQNRSTNPKCTNNCPSGWQDDNLNQCITTCPNGYFKQTLLNGSSISHNKCVKVCTGAFGNNITGSCVNSCPSPTYADPTTQLCQKACPASYFSQIANVGGNRTCTQTCENGQYGNPFYWNCSNNSMNCPAGYYADSNTHLCQQTCSIIMPGSIIQVAENSTRMCQTTCTTGYADYDITQMCVGICPSSPSRYGFISGTTRKCVSSCNLATTGASNLFGDSQANRTCVQKCTATPTSTFGQNSSSLCVQQCLNINEYGDPLTSNRYCVTSCTQSPATFSYIVTKLCVSTCPDTYYGDKYSDPTKLKCSTSCPNGYWGNSVDHLCQAACPSGYFGNQYDSNRPCVSQCPSPYYGQYRTTGGICVATCDSGYWADGPTRLCTNVKTACSNTTYADPIQQLCVNGTSCTTNTYADNYTQGCQISCTNPTSHFGDPSTHLCVTICPSSPDYYSQNGYCVATCVGAFADYQNQRTCVSKCSNSSVALYGNSATSRCVLPISCQVNYYADNQTQLCVNPCTGTLPFGDSISRQCVLNCPDNYYGSPLTHTCVLNCDNSNQYYADNITGNCELTCSVGTYGVNDTVKPVCQYQCPSGSYAKDGIQKCVANCGSGYYGDSVTGKCYSDPTKCSSGYYANSVSNLCVLPVNCQTVSTVHYFAQNSTKTCVNVCLNPNYGDSALWLCISVCNQTSYGQNTTRLCLSGCSSYSTYAQDTYRLCVNISDCASTPVSHFSDSVNYICVQPLNCPPNTYADNQTRKCVTYCPTNPVTLQLTYADVYVSRYCVTTCPDLYYADSSSGNGFCVSTCVGSYRFRDNSTKSCVSICPASNLTFGDSIGNMCVYTCPSGYFAQQDSNRRCVSTCAANSWGNSVTRVCITDPLLCPSGTWADDFTHLCTSQCSSSQNYYGYNITKKCVTSCIAPSFAYDPTRVCIDICPASLIDSGLFGDPMTTPTRKCFSTCQTANLYRDIAASRTCQSQCTYNSTYQTYADSTTMSCQSFCSSYPLFLYADDFSKSCVLTCSNGYHFNDTDQKCISTCPILLDPTSNKCVEICPRDPSTNNIMYANLITKTCVLSSSCPTSTYASDDLLQCVSTCPTNTYIYLTNCVTYCPTGYYKDNTHQTCVVPNNCPSGLYADDLSISCVSKCLGNFADSTLKKCVNACSGSLYADVSTGLCKNSCSTGYSINTATQSCVSNCQLGLFYNPSNNSCSSICLDPYFADSTTNTCVSQCTSNPLTFASTSNGRVCTSNCLSTEWKDVVNRVCVTTCSGNTYSYSVNKTCVSFCPSPDYYSQGTSCVKNCSSNYSDDITRSCVSSCPSGYYKDDTTFRCVAQCSLNYYSSTASSSCVSVCPSGTFADEQQGKCVTQCSTSPPLFAYLPTKVCIQTCPGNTYADFTTYTCTTSCPSNYFADNTTKKCLSNCSVVNLFADSNLIPKACTNYCSVATSYADQLSFRCVTSCPIGYYSYTLSRKCLQFCPFGYFADNSTFSCVTSCSSSYPYADSLTHLCVNSSSCSGSQFAYLATGTNSGGKCRTVCPSGYYSNPLSKKCQTSCPFGFYASTINQTCTQTCSVHLYMDNVNRKCVSNCPSANNLFGDPFTRQCVTTCNISEYLYADSLTQKCAITCSGNQYAYFTSTSYICVSISGCGGGLYADPFYKKCVSQCYNNTYGYNGICYTTCPTTPDLYADPIQKICVVPLACSAGFYADSIKRSCVSLCDIATATFAYNITKKCVNACPGAYFADNSTRTCVSKCPDIPKMYGQNNICVQNCAYLSFADPTSNLCASGCQNGYFADSSTLKCVLTCPQGTFGDNSTNKCVSTCPSSKSYFGQPISRLCVLNCPNNTFSDPNNNRKCMSYCLPPLYAQNLTNSCQVNCLTGFSNSRTQQCIEICTAGYYGYNQICYKSACPIVTPTVYADDVTNLCQLTCPDGTYGDLTTLTCVKICPISNFAFADSINHVCTKICPDETSADYSTRSCVAVCPEIPALFSQSKICVLSCSTATYADNSTRSCVSVTSCPIGTYADNSTYQCVSKCPIHPLMYGLNQSNLCVIYCPASYDLYADNYTQTCVSQCPPQTETFADPVKRACVTTCSLNYFAVNTTQRCQLQCSVGFSDSLLRKCVTKCSIDPIFYGDAKSNTCVNKCPINSYGDPLTQQCDYDDSITGVSTCPLNYYADITTQLCVQKCPMKYNLYANQDEKKCLIYCPAGYFKDNSTMTCVLKCSNYPNYYADSTKMQCVAYCPVNYWADDYSKTCVSNCPSNTFAQNSTWRCVNQCLNSPLTFGNTVEWTCVSVCPSNTYSYFQTFLCLLNCPNNTYADNISKQCVKKCPNQTYAYIQTNECLSQCTNNTFADNSSNSCVNKCPKYPAYFADSTTNTCVFLCPFNYYSYEDTRECVLTCPDNLYRQNSSSSCVRSCNYAQNTYADNVTRYCVLTCSVGSYADPTTRICVATCPDQPPMFASNGTQSCVKNCPGVTFGDNSTRSCVNTCPTNSLSLVQNNLCVLFCPIGYFAHIPTAYCLVQCPSPYYADPSTRTCVTVCPTNQLLFASVNPIRACVSTCPDGSYADQISNQCLPQCPLAVFPAAQTYAADYNNKCVQQCSLPTFAYVPTLKCVNQCPNPYFNNVTDHICYQCPTICNSCTSSTNCQSCISGYYLQNGVCLGQCTGIYYANPTSMLCVVSKSCRPYFGVNSTNLCQSTCPTGSFPNFLLYRCDACPSTCTNCSSLNSCSSCITQAQFYNNVCYSFCSSNPSNSTNIYYDSLNQTCLAQCPDGTYLFVLFCKTCASNCTNCIGTATNCTICANGLYLQGTNCVSQCSSGYLPNANLTCAYCGSTCGSGLTFQTNITTINGQSTVFLNFSSAINITGDLYNTFNVVTNASRRLLATSGYTIQIVDSNTIKIIFPPGQTVQYAQIQITNPTNIQDQFGNIPYSVRAQVISDISNLYSKSISEIPNSFTDYFKFLAIVAIFAFMFQIQLLKFLQLVFIHYFVVMTLPPQLSKILIGLKISTLDYVPSIYQIPSATLLSNVPGKVYDLIGDFSFLRNASSTITLMIIIIGLFLLLKLLSLPQINKFKKSRVWIRQLIDQKFSYAVFIDLMSIIFMNTIFMAFLQLNDYTFYDSFSSASVIMAHIFIVLMISIVAYLSYKIINFFIQYPKLSQNLKKASEIILKDQQIKLLNSTNIFLFQMKKIDLRNLLYPKVNNQNILPFKCIYKFNFLSLLCPIITFLRAIILSIIIVLAPDTITQMVLAIALNFLTLLYFIRARPYSFKYHKYRIKNYLAIFHEVSLIIIELLILVLGIMYKDQKSAQQKQSFSYSIIYLLTFVTAISFIFFCFRIWLQIYRKMWIPFIQSQIFKKNFSVKYAQYQAEKQKNKKLLKGIDPKAKQALKALIQGYKSQKSSLRPNETDKQNPQLPMKYKITYFDRDSSSIASSGTSLTKKQKKSMLKEIFTSEKDGQLKKLNQKQAKQYEQILTLNQQQATQVQQFQQYEQQIEIKAKDLSKYIANAQQILRLHRKHQEELQI